MWLVSFETGPKYAFEATFWGFYFKSWKVHLLWRSKFMTKKQRLNPEGILKTAFYCTNKCSKINKIASTLKISFNTSREFFSRFSEYSIWMAPLSNITIKSESLTSNSSRILNPRRHRSQRRVVKQLPPGRLTDSLQQSFRQQQIYDRFKKNPKKIERNAL